MHVDENSGNEENLNVLDIVEVIGVSQLDVTYKCVTYKNKVLIEHKYGRCTKCHMLQRIDRCIKEVSGRIIVECKDTVVSLQGFGPVLSAIVGSDEVSDEALLEAPPFKVVYNENHVIVEVGKVVN